MATSSQKLKALKCQLDFRKKVLEQKASNEIYFMTRNKTKLTVEEVTRNLCTLLTPGGSPNDSASSATVVP